MFRLILALAFALFATSCATQKQPRLKTQEIGFKECLEQRPQFCTREYMPVCATRDTGIRCLTTPCPASEQKTYGNSCEACADIKVSGYVIDACPSASPAK